PTLVDYQRTVTPDAVHGAPLCTIMAKILQSTSVPLLKGSHEPKTSTGIRFHEGRTSGQRRANVGSERFHEGRGAGKSTTPGGREKHAYFLEMRPEPAFKGTGRLRQDL